MKEKSLALIIILMAGLLFGSSAIKAQNISATATLDASSINTGEAIRLDIVVEGQALASEPVLEIIDGLEIRTLGRSSSTSFVNGQYSATTIYSYQIIGWKQGSYTLGPYEVRVKKEKVMTNAVTLQVNSASKSTTPQIPDDSSPLGDKLFMEMELGKTKLFVGEKAPLKIRVYYSEINVDNEWPPPVIDQPEFIIDSMNLRQGKERINGRSYQVVEFFTNLTPVKTGKFVLRPIKLSIPVIIKQQPGNSFFSTFSRHPIELKSNQLNLNVLPLPSGKPDHFSGGVGRFQIQVTGGPNEVLQGEPVTIRMTVTGNGNFQALSAPKLNDVQGLKVYDAQKKNPVKGETGQIHFEQVVIPIDPAVKKIGPFQLSYFDPYQGSYRQATAQAIPVKVKPNPNFKAVLFPDSDASTENYGKDLVFIKERLGSLKRRDQQLIYQRWFWWLQLIPLLGLVITLGYKKYHRMAHSDSPRSRAVRAGGRAVKQMAKVKTELTAKPDHTLEALHSIIREYLGEKYQLTSSGMTGSVVEQIAGFGVDTETLREIKEFFEQYDYYRFTGSKIGPSEAQQLWEKVNQIIKTLGQVENFTVKAVKAPERRGQNGKF